MKHFKYISVLMTVILFTACSDASDSAKNTLEWEGVYTNVLPCADCDGIQTTIELNKDLTYSMKLNYLGIEGIELIEFSGTFKWIKRGNQIKLTFLDNAHNGPDKYIVKDNLLIQLDMDGNEITNSQFDYSLEKISNLIDKEWKLTELYGDKIVINDDYSKQPLFRINNEYIVNGNGVCNNFFGTAVIRSGHKITFSHLASTMMACANNMQLETSFFQAFEHVAKYNIENDELTLYSDNLTPVAVFTKVDK